MNIYGNVANLQIFLLNECFCLFGRCERRCLLIRCRDFCRTQKLHNIMTNLLGSSRGVVEKCARRYNIFRIVISLRSTTLTRCGRRACTPAQRRQPPAFFVSCSYSAPPRPRPDRTGLQLLPLTQYYTHGTLPAASQHHNILSAAAVAGARP